MVLIIPDASGNGKGAGFSKRNEIAGELEGVGRSQGVVVFNEFNAVLNGTFVATLRLERSLDGGVTYYPLTALGDNFSFTGPCQEVFNEPQPGVLYAWNCTEYTSGTIAYRIGQ